MAHTPETKRRARAKLLKKRRDWLMTNGPCQSCGSVENLEVDHIDPSLKISHRVWSWAEPVRMAELAKCQVLCSVCHKKKTAAYALVQLKHGERSLYDKHKCRCDLCVAAHAIRMAKYHKEHPRRVVPRAPSI